MKPSNKFNHRRKFERDMPTQRVDQTPHAVFTATGAVDSDFEDFGERTDYTVAPDLVVHHFTGDHGMPVHAAERLPAHRLAE